MANNADFTKEELELIKVTLKYAYQTKNPSNPINTLLDKIDIKLACINIPDAPDE